MALLLSPGHNHYGTNIVLPPPAIVGGYYLGTSLTPEAKTYRLLADILNDAAIISDTLSPYLAFVTLSAQYPFVHPGTNSSLRVVALCLSGAFRALCGAVAGGSKAALTVHFATDGQRPGDVGDLSAKDGSKETVLALLGMLVRVVRRSASWCSCY